MNELMDEELSQKLRNAGAYGDKHVPEGTDLDNYQVLAHYYIPFTCYHWLIVGGEQDGEDWLLFGYSHVLESDWGSTYLSEMEGVGVCRSNETLKTVAEMKKKIGWNNL